MSDLLPCRFCRFAPHAWLDDYINGRAVTDPEYIIECENGNCSVMPEVRGTYPYMDEVRALWNAANALPAVQPDLTDPAVVHLNMLRGTIAKPSLKQIIHLYGVDALAPLIVRAGGRQ